MNSARIRAMARSALGPVVIVVMAVAAMVLFHRGIVVRDARFEHIAAPWQFVTRHLEIWDDSRGPGVPIQYFSPVVGVVQSLLALLGAPAWLIGRLTLAIYLSIAGVGSWYLWRRLWPDRSNWALVAGLLYAFNPYTAQAIIPSGLFLPVALLPWLVAFTLDGVRRGSGEGWRPAIRAAALVALAVFSVGMLNTASLLLVLLPVALFAILLVLEKVGTWRGLLRYALPTVVLTILISAPMLVVLKLSSPVVSRNLGTTELPETVALSSSSFESWRGLGKWLSYFRWGGLIESPSASAYMTRPWVIVATFAAVALALVALGWKSMPLRRTWGLLLAGSVLFMVGANDPGASPIGRAFRWTFDNFEGAVAFRSTYKGGPIGVLATALLATAGLIVSVRWLSERNGGRTRRRFIRDGFVILVGLALIVSAYPFLRGSRLGDSLSVAEIPQYWEEAFAHFDSVPANERVLVLPAMSRGRYVWGTVNDNLFDARMHPQVLMASSIPGTTGELADAAVSFDRMITNLTVDPAAIAPTLRWLGVGWVLLQKDVDQFALGMPLDPLGEFRTAPGLTLDATFGVDAEGYPMIEVLRVDDPPQDSTLSTGAPWLVSGGPDSIYAMAASGLLDGRPTTFLADLTDSQISWLHGAGAPVVVTDGSRRVASRVDDSRVVTSELLTEDADPHRPILVLDPSDPATQTVAVYADARREFASRAGNSVDEWSPESSAAQAFDGDENTAWWVSTGAGPVEGVWVAVDLIDPAVVDELVVTRTQIGDARVTGARVELIGPSGESESFDLRFDGDVARVRTEMVASTIKVEITSTNGAFGRYGFTSIDVRSDRGPLDLVEWTRVPNDVTRVGAGVMPTFAFARSEHEMGNSRLRREFLVPTASTFELRSRVSIPFTSDVSELDRSCTPWIVLDGVPVDVRVETFDATTRMADVVGCAEVPLAAGDHQIAALGNPLVSVESILLANRGSIGSDRVVVVDALRNSASQHAYGLPAAAGWVTTLIPAHPGWTIAIPDRSHEELVMNASIGWWVDAGDPVTAKVSFGPQSIYRLAWLISILTLLGCVAIQFWRRRVDR